MARASRRRCRWVGVDLSPADAPAAVHRSVLSSPDTLRRLYIVRDDDPAGDAARDALVERANAAGIELSAPSPSLEDFKDDLRASGVDALRAGVRVRLAPQDVARLMELVA